MYYYILHKESDKHYVRVEPQSEKSFANIKSILEDSGATLYKELRDMPDYHRRVEADFFIETAPGLVEGYSEAARRALERAYLMGLVRISNIFSDKEMREARYAKYSSNSIRINDILVGLDKWPTNTTIREALGEQRCDELDKEREEYLRHAFGEMT